MRDEDVTPAEPDPAVDPAAESHSTDAATDRRKMLRRMLTGAAFAAPVVTSFSMDGLGIAPSTAGAGTVASPWFHAGGAIWEEDPAGGGWAYLPGTGTPYINQQTNFWGSYLATGALGIRFSCETALGDLHGSVRIADVDGLLLDQPNILISPPGIETDYMFAAATTKQAWAIVDFRRLPADPASRVDNVSIRGLYP